MRDQSLKKIQSKESKNCRLHEYSKTKRGLLRLLLASLAGRLGISNHLRRQHRLRRRWGRLQLASSSESQESFCGLSAASDEAHVLADGQLTAERGPTVCNEATLCCGHTGGTTMGLRSLKVPHQLALHDVIGMPSLCIASSCGGRTSCTNIDFLKL